MIATAPFTHTAAFTASQRAWSNTYVVDALFQELNDLSNPESDESAESVCAGLAPLASLNGIAFNIVTKVIYKSIPWRSETLWGRKNGKGLTMPEYMRSVGASEGRINYYRNLVKEVRRGSAEYPKSIRDTAFKNLGQHFPNVDTLVYHTFTDLNNSDGAFEVNLRNAKDGPCDIEMKLPIAQMTRKEVLGLLSSRHCKKVGDHPLRLTKLEITGNARHEQSEVVVLIESLANDAGVKVALTSLNIANVPMTFEAIQSVVKVLAEGTEGLTHLAFQSNDFATDRLTAFVKSLPNLTSLKVAGSEEWQIDVESCLRSIPREMTDIVDLEIPVSPEVDFVEDDEIVAKTTTIEEVPLLQVRRLTLGVVSRPDHSDFEARVRAKLAKMAGTQCKISFENKYRERL